MGNYKRTEKQHSIFGLIIYLVQTGYFGSLDILVLIYPEWPHRQGG